jgi:type I restriction enzyme S subunit
LVIEYNRITITGYDESQTQNQSEVNKDDNKRPFKGFTQNIALKGYAEKVDSEDGYIDYMKPNRINLDDAEKERYLLNNGDFLFARVNGNPEYVGRCAVFKAIDEPVYFNDHIIRVRFDCGELNGLFASELFNSSYGKSEMKDKIKTSAGQYTINQVGIGAIRVPRPPLPLQTRFADFVRATGKSKFALQRGLDKLEILYQSLMQKCFAGELFN